MFLPTLSLILIAGLFPAFDSLITMFSGTDFFPVDLRTKSSVPCQHALDSHSEILTCEESSNSEGWLEPLLLRDLFVFQA